MSMTIRLDLPALNALFPEGSEARVDLQRAVVANLVQRLSLKDAKFLDEQMRNEITEATRKALVDADIIRKQVWGGPLLTDTFTQRVRAEALAGANEVVRQEARAALVSEKEQIEPWVKHALDLHANGEARKVLRTLAREIIHEMLTAGAAAQNQARTA